MPSVMFVPRICVPLLEGDFSLISIGDPGQEDEFATKHPERLRLEFHDTDEYIGEGYTHFGYFDAVKILNWLEDQGDKDIVVHCEGGISRSVATAKFMIDELDYTHKLSERSYNDFSGHNILVLRQLQAAHLDRLEAVKRAACGLSFTEENE